MSRWWSKYQRELYLTKSDMQQGSAFTIQPGDVAATCDSLFRFSGQDALLCITVLLFTMHKFTVLFTPTALSVVSGRSKAAVLSSKVLPAVTD